MSCEKKKQDTTWPLGYPSVTSVKRVSIRDSVHSMWQSMSPWCIIRGHIREAYQRVTGILLDGETSPQVSYSFYQYWINNEKNRKEYIYIYTYMYILFIYYTIIYVHIYIYIIYVYTYIYIYILCLESFKWQQLMTIDIPPSFGPRSSVGASSSIARGKTLKVRKLKLRAGCRIHRQQPTSRQHHRGANGWEA